MSQTYFTPAVYRFIKDLAANNNRDWFAANKSRYEAEVRDPALRFVVDFGAHLMRISPHFLSDPRPSGGALFRIYRDTRFSRDKTPYKDHVGLYFRHEAGKTVHTPGFYLHLQPGASFVGLGLWHPDTATLKPVREAVAAHPDRWRRAVERGSFPERFTVSGESLKRVPRGHDPQHPLAEILKLKDFTGYAPLTQKQVTAPGFLEEFAGLCAAGSPLVKFLCEAIGQDF